MRPAGIVVPREFQLTPCATVAVAGRGPADSTAEGVDFDMDFSKLGQNEKLALYGSVALIVGGVVGYSYGVTALGILAAIAMLVIIFLPQLSATTKLPGSKGSLMVAAGGLAGIAMVLALLTALDSVFVGMNFRDIFFLIAVAGGLLMAWAGWREFQSEGGKFQIGTAGGSAPAAPSAPPAAAAPPPSPSETDAPAPAEPAAAADIPADDPYRRDDEDRPAG